MLSRTGILIVVNREVYVSLINRLLVSLPRDFEAQGVSPEPDRVCELPGRVVYVFRRNLRINDNYPVARLVFRRAVS